MTSTPQGGKNRFGYIDCARGIAALYVAIQHTLEHAGLIGGESMAGYSWLLNLGQAGVFTFFMVSGFIIPVSLERAKSTPDFWKKRILRIYPLYIFIFSVTIAIAVFLEHRTLGNPAVLVTAQMLFLSDWIGMPNYVGGSWTLLIEFMWYIGLFIWWRWQGGIHPRRLFYVSIVLVVAIGFVGLVSPVRLPLGRLGFLLACVWGLVMVTYSRQQISLQETVAYSACLSAVSAFLLYVGFFLRPSDHVDALSYSVVNASWALGCLTFFFFYLFRNSSVICNGVLMYLGTISYSLYLVHSTVLRFLEQFHISGYALVALGLTATLVVSHFTYRYIEQPFINLGHMKRAPAATS